MQLRKPHDEKPKFVLVHSAKDTDAVMEDLRFLFGVEFTVVRQVTAEHRFTESEYRRFATRCLDAHQHGISVLIHNTDVAADRDLALAQLKTLTRYSLGYENIPKELLPLIDLELLADARSESHYWHTQDTRDHPQTFNRVVETE